MICTGEWHLFPLALCMHLLKKMCNGCSHIMGFLRLTYSTRMSTGPKDGLVWKVHYQVSFFRFDIRSPRWPTLLSPTWSPSSGTHSDASGSWSPLLHVSFPRVSSWGNVDDDLRFDTSIVPLEVLRPVSWWSLDFLFVKTSGVTRSSIIQR